MINDEVFTPPSLVNDILDLFPAELWSNQNAKFLDPVSKSGVFMREMAKRLMLGLETKIPDKQERISYTLVLTKNVEVDEKLYIYLKTSSCVRFGILSSYKKLKRNINERNKVI